MLKTIIESTYINERVKQTLSHMTGPTEILVQNLLTARAE